MKRPASQYYWGDWRRDTALQSCSIAARGLWHEMNCLMHDCEPYGHLCVGTTAMQPAQLARLVGITPKECVTLLAELETATVFSRTDAGVIYSRRMVRDEDLRERRANGGQAGAEHGIKGAEHGAKGGRPKKPKGGFETPLQTNKQPPPASASASAEEIHPPSASHLAPPGTGTRLPPGWTPPDSDAELARSLGFANGRAEAELAKFRDYWAARPGAGGRKLDWPATWRNWLRKAAETRPQRAAGAADEPAWRREQRERNEAFLGPFSASAAKRRRETLEAADAAPPQLG